MKALGSKKLLVAGGGTGGHVLAGVAVADTWKARWGNDAAILFVGAAGGIEEKLIPKAGFPLQILQLGSLNRVSIQRKIRTFFQLPFALFRAALILLVFRPEFLLGVGGYSSGPVVLMARLLHVLRFIRVKIGILEQNAVPGFTNRILSHFTHVVITAFSNMDQYFPGKKVVVTGNPIRSSMKPMSPASRNPFVIFVFGGSQGAIGVNSLVLETLPHLTDLSEILRWIHQTGEKDYDRVREGYQKTNFHARVEKFIYDMPTIYAEASLLICRAGSSTLAEIAAVGRASLLIPLPTAADNHQEKNAQVFADAGAARVLSQRDAKGGDLAKVIREFVNGPSQLSEMEQKVTQFFRPRAAEEVVQALVNS